MAGRPKAPKISGTQKMAEVKLRGSEPQNVKIETDLDYMNAMNWYAAYGDKESAIGYLKVYMSKSEFTKDQIDVIELGRVDPLRLMSLGHRARMMSRGCVFGEKFQGWFDEGLQKLIQNAQAKRLQEVKPTTAQRLPGVTQSDKIYEEVGHVEEALDQFLLSGTSDFSAYQFFKNRNSRPDAAKIVIDRYTRIIEELNAGLEEVRPMPTRQKRAYIVFLQKIIDECNLFLGAKQAEKSAKKVQRKPRQVKAKPAEVLVKNVRYQAESSEFKISSIQPAAIIGAKALVIFNTKNRNLQLYIAADDTGLAVKGTKLMNVDEAASFGYKLRKPEVFLPATASLNLKALQVQMRKLTTMEHKGNGRLTEDTILLKVFK
jgi:hypothetical protein